MREFYHKALPNSTPVRKSNPESFKDLAIKQYSFYANLFLKFLRERK